MELEQYVKQYLPTALNTIIQSQRVHELQNLSIYEKAIIFAYTDATTKQHQVLNTELWESEGKEISDFGRFLDKILTKLDAYKGLVFRGAHNSYCDIERYKKGV